MAESPAARALVEASAGLNYPSETDAPWTVFTWRGAEGAPTPEGVRRYSRHKAGTPSTARSVDEFFGQLAQEQDWFGDAEKADAAKYRSLRDTVKSNLSEPIVVCVGRRRLTAYVVGRDPAGGWTGLKTISVET
jgi:hypothetical protein